MRTSIFGAVVAWLLFPISSDAAAPQAEWHPLQQRAGKSVVSKDERPLPVRRPVEMKTLAEVSPDGQLLTRCSEFSGPDFSRVGENSAHVTVRSEAAQ